MFSWFLPVMGAVTAPEPPPALVLPFILLLLCIALMPFLRKEWWEHHYPKVAVALGSLTVLYYLVGLRSPERVLLVAHEYLSFMTLIASLYVVSGSIHIQVKGEAKPEVNCLFLLVGALLANVIGTTGASMLLIRPWLRMNRYRITSFHVVFFIFIVSNVGGCLTPVGDPPLFLGYLRGVPFWWVLEHCWQAWAVAVLALLATFWVLDRRNFARAKKAVRDQQTAEETWRFDGLRNLIPLGLILGAIFLPKPPGLREALMLAAALTTYFTTPKRIHQANDFSFGPVREVAWLFAGIFATMIPALDYLELHSSQLGLNSALKLYWLTGSLSAVLDNAPTYLTFLAAAMGRHQLSLHSSSDVQTFVNLHGSELTAISIGAVFFGAMTYIGNGPNFMVKALAEKARVKTPTFFGYLLRYALPFLLPIFALVAFLCFSRWRVF
jgi:Na+/H+ antiporter NhaD/arsenite permease-like protein